MFKFVWTCCGIAYILLPIARLVHTDLPQIPHVQMFPMNLKKAGSHSVDFDVSPDYLRWSQWQKETVAELRRNISTSHAMKYLPISTKVQSTTTNSFIKNETSQTGWKFHQNSPNVKRNTPAEDFNNQKLNEVIPPEINNNSEIRQTSISNQTGPTYSTGVSVMLAMLTVCISLITIGGNILVLISFFVERALRTASNYFLASLAVTDLLIGIFSMNFYTLYLILGSWPLGRLSCDLWLSLDYTACLTSQYTVLFITADRFFSVRLPAKYSNWRTGRKVGIMMAASWIIPSAVFYPTIMAWPLFKSNMKTRPRGECYAEFANDPVFNTIFTLCYFWVTLFVMMGLYAKIYKVAKDLQKRSDEKRNRVSGLITNQSNDKQMVHSEKRKKSKTVTRLPHSSSSLVGGKDSSGFDSDLEHKTSDRKKINDKLLPRPNGQSGQLNRVIGISEKQELPIPLLLQSKENHGNAESALILNDDHMKLQGHCLPKITMNSAHISIDCPIHGDSTKKGYHVPTDDQKYSPISLNFCRKEFVQISSPILTDDDSGFDMQFNGNYSQSRQTYLPNSPPLCICTDSETDHNNKIDQTKLSTPDASKLACKRKQNDKPENKESIMKPPQLLNIPPVKQDGDVAYQNRVLEAFKRRIAANNLTNTEPSATSCHDSSKLTTAYELTTTPSTTNIFSLEDHSGIDSNSVLLSHSNSDSRQNPSQSPIWKPQTYSELDTFSTGCSLHGFTYYSQTIGDHLHPECYICAGHDHFSDSSQQSSTTGGDYVSRNLTEHRLLCCTLGLGADGFQHRFWHPEATSLVSCVSRSKQYILNLPANAKRKLSEKKEKHVERGHRENRARKALKTITFILGAFVLCWTPYHVVIMIKGICDEIEQRYTCVNDVLYSVTYWLCYMNSPINPFCYALANAQFKKTFLRIFHGDFRRN